MRPCSKSLGKQGTLKGRLFEGMFVLKGEGNVRFEGTTFALNGLGRWSFFGERARRKRT